jgi:dTDP-4-amino-4,6-dideoxygalactose transaminase
LFTLQSDDDAKAMKALRFNGCCDYEGARERYWVPAMSDVRLDLDGIWPNNFCLGEAQCAVGRLALERLDETNDKLIAQGMKVREALADVPEITVARIPEGYRHVFHQCNLHFDGSTFGKTRDDLLDILTKEYRIKSIVQYYPLYRYPLFRSRGFGEHDCPVLESWWDDSFSLPWWCGMPDETVDYLTSSVKAAIAGLKRE